MLLVVCWALSNCWDPSEILVLCPWLEIHLHPPNKADSYTKKSRTTCTLPSTKNFTNSYPESCALAFHQTKMPNSHPEICASPNSLLTFYPPDISLIFSDSIHQDICAIVWKKIKEKKPKRHKWERKKIKRPRHEEKEKREKYTQDRAHMFSSLSLSFILQNKRESWSKKEWPKIFRIRISINSTNNFQTLAQSQSRRKACISWWSGFWLRNICAASMPTFYTYPKIQIKLLEVGRSKKASIFYALVRNHLHIRAIWENHSRNHKPCFYFKNIQKPKCLK